MSYYYESFSFVKLCQKKKMFSTLTVAFTKLIMSNLNIIHMTNTSPSLFITLFLYQQKSFLPQASKKLFCDTAGISLKCAIFHSAHLIQYVVICIKMHGWKVSCSIRMLHSMEEDEWYLYIRHTVVRSICVFVICSTYMSVDM